MARSTPRRRPPLLPRRLRPRPQPDSALPHSERPRWLDGLQRWRGVVLTSLVTGLIAAILAVLVPRGLASAMDWWSDSSDAPVLRATVVSAWQDEPHPGDTPWAVSQAPGDADIRAWNASNQAMVRGLAARGAVPIGASLVSVVLENIREAPVVVAGMRAEIVARRKPPSGALFVRGPIGGEPIERVDVVFDLDEARPEARRYDPETNLGGERYFDSRYLTLARGEKIVVNLRTITLTCHCRWRVQLILEVDGEVRRQTLDRPGDPFWITRPAKAYQAAYEWDAGLTKADPDEVCDGDCTAKAKQWITHGAPG